MKKCDHIAIVVFDLESAISKWKKLLQLNPSAIEDMISEKVKVCFFRLDNIKIELVWPYEENETLRKRGEGIAHFCLESDDIHSDFNRLKEKYTLTSSAPTQGADGKEVFFVHPKSLGRVLVEFSSSKTS